VNTEVEMGDEGEGTPPPQAAVPSKDPDAFFATNTFRIVYQTNNFFLPQIRDMIDGREVINLRPEYQRRSRWNVVQKSRLIESLLLNIPIPPIFLYENEAARYEVMDGQQRLSAIRDFFAGDYALTGLTELAPLKGLRYTRCPPRIKRALDRATLSAIVLLLESEFRDDQASRLNDLRRFVFERLNTGGTKLNQQELRNAVYPGPLNDAIIELTRDAAFTTAFGIPSYVEVDPNEYYENEERQKNNLFQTMGDCQLVLRYFALKNESNIRGAMQAMLDRAMAQKITNQEAEQLKQEYRERFQFLFDLFDGKPFLLPADDKGRHKVSAALYDASMVAINDLWDRRISVASDKAGVQSRMQSALSTPENLRILTGQGNTAEAVRQRIAFMRSVFLPG